MKRIVSWILALTMALGLCACGGGQEASEPNEEGLKELNVVLDWYPNALHAFLYVAMEKGYFAEEGLQINIQFPSNSNDAISLVAAGQAEIGMYYQQDIIQTVANQGIPVRSIGAVVQAPLNIVLALEETGIQTPADLVGKTVGYAGTELSEAITRCIMENVGADFSDVTMIDVGFDLMSSMTTGNVDATIGCYLNHEVPQMEEEGFSVTPIALTDYGIPTYYDSVFLSSDRMIESDPDTLAAFLRAAAKGFADMKADPAEALAILLEHQNAENFPLSQAVEQKSMEILLPMMETAEVPFLTQSDACWQENIDWMVDQGLIQEPIPLDQVRVNLEF